MSRSLRMFEIIQALRGAASPVTARDLAERLEVTERTVYRDVAALQAMRVPIDGQAGVGYILRPGFDLPPLNLTIDEAEAVVVGLALLDRTGDQGLACAAKDAGAKIAAALARSGREALADWPLYASGWTAAEDPDRRGKAIRAAIRDARALHLVYTDADGDRTERTVLPLAMLYYLESVVLAAWCELRQDFRHFRLDRMAACDPLDETFPERARRLRAEWRKAQALP